MVAVVVHAETKHVQEIPNHSLRRLLLNPRSELSTREVVFGCNYYMHIAGPSLCFMIPLLLSSTLPP